MVGMAETHAIQLFISGAILEEVAEVLERPRLRIRSPRLTFERIDRFLDRLRHFATLVKEVPKVVRLSRDPDDEVYLDLAIAAGAEYIVTRDHDLLDLTRAKQRTDIGLPDGLRIVTPEELLTIVRDQRLSVDTGRDESPSS